MKEEDIMYEVGRYWVLREADKYTVVRMGVTHGVSDSAYEKTENGLSIAKARCDYLHNRQKGESMKWKDTTSYSRGDTKGFALINDGFDYQFRWEGQPCHVQS